MTTIPDLGQAHETCGGVKLVVYCFCDAFKFMFLVYVLKILLKTFITVDDIKAIKL